MNNRHVTVAALALLASAAAEPPARLYGWWVNPTPGNVSLLDGRTEHLLERQGDPAPPGPRPRFTPTRWVGSGHAGYGYGCACLTVLWNRNEVSRIVTAHALPLATCRHDPRLRRAERLARP